MIHCATKTDVEILYASVPQELIEAAKEVMGKDEQLTFESIANQCANLSPAAVEVASSEAVTPAAQDNKDVSCSTVGKQFRYVGVFQHQLKDETGNPILDAEGKPLVLKRGSELILVEVERSPNPDYAIVRPIGFDCQKLGLLRSQLQRKEVTY